MHVARSVAMVVVALGATLGLASTASAATCAGAGYLATSDGTIQRFSTSTNTVTTTIATGSGSIADLAVAPNGEEVYAVDSTNKVVRILDTATNTVVAAIGGFNQPVAIALSPDGTRGYVVDHGSNEFAVIDLSTSMVLGPYTVGTSPTDAVVSADGSLLYVTSDAALVAYSTTSGTPQTTYSLGGGTAPRAVARSTTTAYVANGSPFSVSSALLSGSTASTLFSGMAGQPRSIAISPDGTTLYLGTGELGRGSLMAAPTGGGTLTSIGSAASSDVNALAVTPDSSTVYAAAADLVTVTNATGSPATTLGGSLASGITAIAICPAVAPGAPTGVTADAGDTIASISWTAPADTGGARITGYTATASPGGATCTTTGATTCLFTGLRNGTAYTFTVTAANVAGTGAASVASNRVTPRKDTRARALTLGSRSVTFSRKGVGVAFAVTVNGPGVIAAAMSYKGTRACQVSKRVWTAGTYRVKCVLSTAGRALARKRARTYTLFATFSPANGALASARVSVVVPRRR